MGEDPGPANARSGGAARLRAGGASARRAAGSEEPVGHDHDRDHLGPFRLTETALAEWGHRIGRTAALPLVLGLRGELGTGKSVLARAVARGAGVESPMPSPTFNLLFVYAAPARSAEVFHLDLYRLR